MLRTIMFFRHQLVSKAVDIAWRLVGLLSIVSSNPSNPRFNHCLFEALSAIIRYADSKDAQVSAKFEQMLFPVIQSILAQGIVGACSTSLVFSLLISL